MDNVNNLFDNELDPNGEYRLVVSVVQRGYSDEVIIAARTAGATGAVVIQGKGTTNEKRKFFGFTVEPENEVVLMVVPKMQAVPITKAIYEAVDYKSEARGLVFVLPVSHVSGMSHSKGYFDKDFEEEFKKHVDEVVNGTLKEDDDVGNQKPIKAKGRVHSAKTKSNKK